LTLYKTLVMAGKPRTKMSSKTPGSTKNIHMWRSFIRMLKSDGVTTFGKGAANCSLSGK
jgi:hypothetical protein